MSIADSCHWDRDCIVNSVASALLYLLRGSAPRELVGISAFRDSARCDDGSCTLPISDHSVIKDLDEESIRDGVTKAFKFLDLGDVPALVQLLMEAGLESGIYAVDDNVGMELEGELGARVNEALGTALYSVAAYDRAISRFNAAMLAYERVGESGRARFMEAMSKVARAEDLRVKALKAHDEGRHDIEEKMIEEASKLYASSVVSFREAIGIEEARANEALSMMDSTEVLANYYFTHGDIARAMQYYNSCSGVFDNLEGVGGGYWDFVKLKGDLCKAFYLLCKAIEEGDWRVYEEAGDKFLDIINRGLVDEITTEGAVMSYKGALDGINEVDDAVRVYSKYVKAVSKYFDNIVRDRYGNFEAFMREFREGDPGKLAREFNTDVNTLKLYVIGKVLTDVVREEGLDEDAALEILAYLAGLGLNPMDADVEEIINELRGFIADREFISDLRELLLRVKDRLNQIPGS